jgi:uncharacterized protein (DUF58 family)
MWWHRSQPSKLRARTIVCIEGIYYTIVMVFIFSAAMLRQLNLLILLFAAMLVALLWNWRTVVVSLRGMQVQRSVPEAVSAGDRIVVEMRVTNTKRRLASWAVLVEDTLTFLDPHRPWSTRAAVLFTRIAGGETQTQAYEGQLHQRGRYQLGPVHISTKFPLGLVKRTWVVDCPGSLLVYPRTGTLSRKWRQRRQQLALGADSARQRHGQQEGDFHSLREYRAGDSRRRIHWRTSARMGKLMVQQYEQQQTNDLALFLDLWLPRDASPQQHENLERAISFAATIVMDQCRRGAGCLVLGLAGAEAKCIASVASRGLLRDALEMLALAQPTNGDTLPALLSEAVHCIPPGGDAVIVGTRLQDLTDTRRFAPLWSNARYRALMGRMLCIHAGTQQLDEYVDYDHLPVEDR